MDMLQKEIAEILEKHKLWINSNCCKGEKANFRNTILRYQFFCGEDLAGADFSYADLRGIYMMNANLYGAMFEAALVKEANFTGANLKSTNLEHANFEDANFQYADLAFANLHACYLGGADLRNANLQGANLYGAFIKDCLLPEKLLSVGKLYKVKNQYVPFHDCLVCLVNINDDGTLDLLEGKSGKMHRNQHFCLRYSLIEMP